MSNYTEQDQDYAAAEGAAPHGFQFAQDQTGPLLNAAEADVFPDSAWVPVQGLLWLGYLTESFELFGHRFVIRTLTRGDRLAVSQLTKEWEETLGLADAYQAATVAASLAFVDDQPIAEIDKAADRLASIQRTFARVQDWYEPVVEAVFNRTVLLSNRQTAAFIALQSK